MRQIFPSLDDPHQEAQTLLPWYVNGTLDECEVVLVETHLAGCAECRRDLAVEETIGSAPTATSLDVERGWAAMREKLQAQTGRDGIATAPASLPRRFAPRPTRRRTSILRRKIPLGWALGAQVAAMALVVGGTRLTMAAGVAEPAYHTLGSDAVSSQGNVIVIFRPETRERDMRGILMGNGARLVDGPTASNAYVLQVSSRERMKVLANLRSDQLVLLAEPIDGGTPQ